MQHNSGMLINPFALNDSDPGGATGRPARVPPGIVSGFDLLVRGWRPALGWVGVLIVAVVGLGVGAGLSAAIWRAAWTGQPIPDLTAGLTPLLAVILPVIGQQVSRYFEIQAGRA